MPTESLPSLRTFFQSNSIDIWTVKLDAEARTVDRCRVLLSPEEAAQARRCGSLQLAQRFTLSRGVLRVLLGSYLAQSAASVRLVISQAGKPGLAASTSGLEFNSSGSADIALYAFASNCILGVDIERTRSIEDMPQLVEQFFHVEEARDFFSLPEEEREWAFFACWTRKEAYVKALGGGLSVPLDSFRMTLRPGEPVGLLPARDGWTLQALHHVEGYQGALAYRDRERPLHIWPVIEATALLDRFA